MSQAAAGDQEDQQRLRDSDRKDSKSQAATRDRDRLRSSRRAATGDREETICFTEGVLERIQEESESPANGRRAAKRRESTTTATPG